MNGPIAQRLSRFVRSVLRRRTRDETPPLFMLARDKKFIAFQKNGGQVELAFYWQAPEVSLSVPGDVSAICYTMKNSARNFDYMPSWRTVE